MVDARHAPDTTNKQPLIPPTPPSAANQSTSQIEHTVGRPADVPKVSASSTMAWVIGLCAFVLLGAVLLWLLPMIGSDRQEEAGTRAAPQSETR